MSNLERLHEARIALDKVLEEVGAEQAKIKDEITAKRKTGWERMFEDLYFLRKYSNYIDTGIELNKGKETLGFEIRDDEIGVISWKHLDCDGRQIEPRSETFFFVIIKDKPFSTKNPFATYKEWMKFVMIAIENWDEVMKEIEKRLEKRMESEMKNKISASEKNQVELEKNLKAISKG